MYLLGTFCGKKGAITIALDTPKKQVEDFLKDNPECKDRITDLNRIKEQRALMNVEFVEHEVVEITLKKLATK